jgi:hypothetical protein
MRLFFLFLFLFLACRVDAFSTALNCSDIKEISGHCCKQSPSSTYDSPIIQTLLAEALATIANLEAQVTSLNNTNQLLLAQLNTDDAACMTEVANLQRDLNITLTTLDTCQSNIISTQNLTTLCQNSLNIAYSNISSITLLLGIYHNE